MNSPMLAATVRDPEDLLFPLLATPKIDGVRAMMVQNTLVSRTFRPIPNKKIRKILESVLPEGADGEIFCGDLHTTTSVAMSSDVDADFRFFWFDWVYDTRAPYKNRIGSVRGYILVHGTDTSHVVPLFPHPVHSIEQLLSYEKDAISKGHEGVVLRVPNGRYKCGRSTLKEGFMMKLKRFTDSEAVIVGTEELVRNTGHKGKTLGSIIARTQDGHILKIGTGYTADQRSELWANRDGILGEHVRFKHMDAVNRSAVFTGIRHIDDIS